MSKTRKITSKKDKKIDFEKEIMSKVASDIIVMKPKWYFIFGTVFSILGIASLSAALIFLINIILFTLRKHGPMAQWKIQTLINNFPLWIPILATIGIIVGIWMLKKYDFSYKKNFPFIIIGFISSIIIAGFIVDRLGLNEIWSHRGVMRRFYQKIENQENYFPKGSVKGRMKNGSGNDNLNINR